MTRQEFENLTNDKQLKHLKDYIFYAAPMSTEKKFLKFVEER